MYAWHPFYLTLSSTAKYMTNSVYKNMCSILPCNFYMKCFYPIKYFVNFAMDTQTRIFIQCHLIRAFTKLWKAPVTLAMSVYLSICMNEFYSHWKDFCEIILQTFSKNHQENSSLVKKTDKYTSTLHEVHSIMLTVTYTAKQYSRELTVVRYLQQF